MTVSMVTIMVDIDVAVSPVVVRAVAMAKTMSAEAVTQAPIAVSNGVTVTVPITTMAAVAEGTISAVVAMGWVALDVAVPE